MELSETVKRFNSLVSLGDSLLKLVELRTGEAQCRMKFDSGRLLRAEGASIFDPAATFEPAWLCLLGVRSIACEGCYQLNSTVVDFGASQMSDGEYAEFYFDLTGGVDPNAFLARVKIVAKGFSFCAEPI